MLMAAVVWLASSAAPFMRGAFAATTPTTVPTPARTVVRDLLAFGTEQRFWSADVIPFIQGKQSGTKTYLRVRAPGDSQWKLITELEAPAVSLGNRGVELLVVLEGGDWKIVADDSARSGAALPGGADVLALAGDGDDIWAIGAAHVGDNSRGAATSSSTQPSSATTQAAASTTPAAARAATTSSSSHPSHPLGLFQLTRGDWTERDVLPHGLDRDDLRVLSFAMLDRKLMLAVVDSDAAIRVFTRDERGWDKGVDITVAGAGGTTLRLLDLRGRPALWVSDRTGPGALYLAGERWQGPIRLQPSGELVNFDRVALTMALGQLRLLASDGKQRFAEQIYNPDGTLAGQATKAVTAPTPLDNKVAQLIQMLIVAVLFIWMMGALKQRPDTQEAAKRVQQLNLAPLGRRIVGGAVDLLPIAIGLCGYLQPGGAMPNAGLAPAPEITYQSPQVAWLAAGIAMYLLHTTACELLFARSLGKFVTGTRVAALDGTRPRVLALLTRNLLRIVDIVLLFPPVFVFFSPLRQRVGDMAAGTLVVMRSPQEPVIDPVSTDPPSTPAAS